MSERGPSIAEIKSAAEGRVEAIADQLAPELATRDRHRRWSLNPTRADTAPNSFCIDVSGPTVGRFMEFAAHDEKGDIIDFVSYCIGGAGGYKTNERRGQAIRWLKEFLGFAALSGFDRERLAKQAAAREEQRAKAEHVAKAKRERNAKFARDLWIAAKPWRGTPVETYLESARGLPVRALMSPLNAIRYEPEAVDGSTGEVMPAMLTAATNAKGQIRGVHTTFLKPDGSGKAEIERAKRFLGDMRGAMMRLHRGASGQSEAKAPPGSDVLAVAEGIENALSWSFLWQAHRTAAAGSVDLIGAVPVSECVSRIIILRDNDKPGSPADRALERAVERLKERAGSRRVELRAPPAVFKDFNDYWRAV